MSSLAHWHIEAQSGPLSAACVDRGIISFLSLVEWVQQLPFARNSDRANYALVLDEECGACSTKNAVVKAVAMENGWSQVQLFLGIYNLSENTNPGVGSILTAAQLSFIPEAHVYLKIMNELRDVTGLPTGLTSFSEYLQNEIEILPDQIGDFKLNWHKKFLLQFAKNQKRTLEEIITIREACIDKLTES